MFERFRKPFTPDYDHAQADLQLRSARDRATAGDWTAALYLLQTTGRDWELRSRRLAVLGIAAGHAPHWVDAWEAAIPGDPTVAILRAEGLTELAGAARGAASARHTSAEQFQEFHRLSALAAAAAQRAVELNPDDPYPWVTRIDAMFADGHQRHDDFRIALDGAVARDPFHFEAHLMAVSFLCQKWYGSHEQMFAAARGPAAAAPAGASVCMLPLLAHFEYALREFGFETRAESLAAKMEYFHRPEVIQEIAWCAGKWRAAGEPRLIARGVTLRHWLALANHLSGQDRAGTRTLLAHIGSYLGSTAAYGYFWMRQAEGFEAVSKWARQ
ncbi:hypothetical protein GCM10010168_17370 [Actinoplanes ianthinogenes]|uniref:DUF4034 domain-containing protein n=1 Tax=Actinoplanes ianthinogenes TaxID=122358 RepID=A0ABM7M723_9ACTN|nr:hypothetical protein [Actinoplanes ianthinogenes]BCJ47379.1 hypothetical protein Aiant_80360 [Actinoplanes ianthinogenes]GGR01415.1 hypothetical protein GCM10010168_17370 [Actinoplanes ianthinogenes]